MTRNVLRLLATAFSLAVLAACSLGTTADMTIRNELSEELPQVVVRVADESVTWADAPVGGEFKHTFSIGRDAHYEVEIHHLDGSITSATGGYLSSGFNTRDTIRIRTPRPSFESEIVE